MHTLQEFAINPKEIESELNQTTINPILNNDVYQSHKENQKILPTRSDTVEFHGTKYELTLFQQFPTPSSWRIPLIYEKSDEKKVNLFMRDAQQKADFILKIYQAVSLAIQLLIRNLDQPIEKNIYPVFLYKENGPYGLYVQEYRILAINIDFISTPENNVAYSCSILDLVAHELAHEYAPNHGRIHEQWFETFLQIAKKQDKVTNAYIIDLISAKLK
jgi:predicted metal-dependent hydrolase